MCVCIPPSAMLLSYLLNGKTKIFVLRLPEIGWENLDILASCFPNDYYTLMKKR